MFYASRWLLDAATQFAACRIPAQFCGIIWVTPMREQFLCAVFECANAVRSLGIALHVSWIQHLCFNCSRFRGRFSVASMISNGISIVGITGSDEVLILVLHNQICNVLGVKNADTLDSGLQSGKFEGYRTARDLREIANYAER
jgi:hypothetical protein